MPKTEAPLDIKYLKKGNKDQVSSSTETNFNAWDEHKDVKARRGLP